MVLGCGGLTGLRYANFSVLPSVSKSIEKNESSMQAWLAGDAATIWIPMGCAFATLTLVDSMALYGAAPAMFGAGVLGTSAFMRAQGLEMPLWYGRKLFRYVTLTIFVMLTLGYLTVRRDMNLNENR